MSKEANKQSGFTLIELLVTMAIVAILAAISYPMYLKQIQKGRRSTAEGYLMDVAQRQQQYFTDARSYAPNVATLNDPVPAEMASYYTIQVCSGTVTTATCPAVATTPPTFVITATAIGAQLPDGNLSIDSTGAKSPTNLW